MLVFKPQLHILPQHFRPRLSSGPAWPRQARRSLLAATKEEADPLPRATRLPAPSDVATARLRKSQRSKAGTDNSKEQWRRAITAVVTTQNEGARRTHDNGLVCGGLVEA